jgi:type IV pilus assembly protein PilV
VLIALLVLSIGLLGVAALQAFSLQANQGAYHRTQAVNLGYEIVDFLRVNRGDPEQALSSTVLPFWQQRAADHLPAGTVDTPVFASDGEVVTVTVRWRDDRLDDEQTGGETVTITARL